MQDSHSRVSLPLTDRRTPEPSERKADTYIHLRVGMAAITMAWPILLWFGGNVHGIPRQSSLSDYYHVQAPAVEDLHWRSVAALLGICLLIYVIFVMTVREQRSWLTIAVGGLVLLPAAVVVLIYSFHFAAPYGAPLRPTFVGVIIALATFLYLYKGMSDLENVVLNTTAIFAVMVVIFPTDYAGDCVGSCPKPNPHGIAGYLFFVCIVVVCLFCSLDTLERGRGEASEPLDSARRLWAIEMRRRLFDREKCRLSAKYRKYWLIYRVIGVTMLLAEAFFVLGDKLKIIEGAVFWEESSLVELFSAYWLIKSIELRTTPSASERAIRTTSSRIRGLVAKRHDDQAPSAP